jgi:adenosylcobinamide-GDP ribazoletransferase
MRAAFAFLTTLGRAHTPTAASWRWFPFVGAAVGALVGTVWWAADRAFTPLLAAALTVVVDLAITGMLHIDGLADTADGLLPHANRARRLEIMRTADVGAFGIAVVASAIVLRTAAFTAQAPSIALIAGLWCCSRTIAAAIPAWLLYARDDGLVSALLDARPTRWLVLACVPAGALAVVGNGLPGLAASVAAILAGLAVAAWASVRVGGFTGDVLGAAIVVSETVGLVVASARW